MKTSFTLATMTAAAALALASCASTPREHPEIVRLQGELQAGQSDSFIAEAGRAELTLAQQHLDMAREDYRRNRDRDLAHHLEMTNGYLQVADVRGDQGRANAEIARLRAQQDELRIASREREARLAQQQVGRYRDAADNAAIAAQNAQMSAQNAEQRATMAQQDAASANQQLAALQGQLKDFEFQITALGGSLTLRDVMFEVDSAQLRPGADQRLQPLANYLRSMPNTSIRIEGHTDSTGGAAYNERLSRDRAESVKQALVAMGIDGNRVQTAGYGLTKPIASNNTVSGREQNRRVEIIMEN